MAFPNSGIEKKGSFIFCINYIPFSLFSFSFPLSSLSHPMSAIQFSVDRPFGVYLYDYFDMVYTAIVGKSANDFAFVEGETPLSTTPQGREPIVQDMTWIDVHIGSWAVVTSSSGCWLYHLLVDYLWWPVHVARFSTLSSQVYLPVAQLSVDFCLGCFIASFDWAVDSSACKPWLLLYHLFLWSMDTEAWTLVLS